MKFIVGFFGFILMVIYQTVVPQRFWREAHLSWISAISPVLSILLVAYVLFLIFKLII